MACTKLLSFCRPDDKALAVSRQERRRLAAELGRAVVTFIESFLFFLLVLLAGGGGGLGVGTGGQGDSITG